MKIKINVTKRDITLYGPEVQDTLRCPNAMAIKRALRKVKLPLTVNCGYSRCTIGGQRVQFPVAAIELQDKLFHKLDKPYAAQPEPISYVLNVNLQEARRA